jgi:F-type H+-transporting ATPase subunit a
MAAEGHNAAPSAGEYIIHHLTHNQNHHQTSPADFSVINYDSLFFSIGLGIVVCFLLYRAARKASPGVPGRFQAAIEILVEMVEGQARGIVHNAQSRKLVAPLALTVYMWIFLMNSMDFLPVDLLPWIGEHVFGVKYLRVVPTADLSVTLAMSITVLLTCLFYNVKIKGAGGWLHEMVSAPFGDKVYLYPVNFLFQIIEFVAKTVSHGMRLFGNMYAGELIFMLIALMGAAWATSATGITLFIGHIIAGTVWSIFHLLIVWLQAFVFMMLTLVYIGQAHDHH